MKKIAIIFCILVFLISFALGIHNAYMYAPWHGFDGVGHVFYIEYVAKNWNMPLPNLGWETHQSPLYYFLGAILMKISGTWKTAQYMNTFIFWFLIVALSFGLWKVYGKWKPVIFGALSLVALPMMNIFPPMVTNEFLNAFWMVLIVTWLIYLVEAKTSREIVKYLILIGLALITGFWTKISIIMILPTVFVGMLIVFLQKEKFRKNIVVATLIMTIIVLISIIPIFTRSKTAQGPSNLGAIISAKATFQIKQNLDFYYRLDWIPKIDMYTTQYYSLWGGAWNSFWTDGQNAVTPFVTFHKKSFVLWSLGFILLPICLYGLWQLKKVNKNVAYVMYMLGFSMLGTYVFYNYGNNHYSGVRLTYEMGIIIPYAFGIAQIGSDTKNKKISLKNLTLILLIIQFATMVSFYWILDWWHVTK